MTKFEKVRQEQFPITNALAYLDTSSSGLISNPFLLTTGVGISSLFVSHRTNNATGFGIIGFTALGPILAVMIIGLFV